MVKMLWFLAVVGCAKRADLAPIDTPPHGGAGPDIARINRAGIDDFRGGRLEFAEEKFRLAVSYDPDARYFFNLCLTLAELGKLDEACQACRAPERNREHWSYRGAAPKLRALRARIDTLAKQRAIALSCSTP